MTETSIVKGVTSPGLPQGVVWRFRDAAPVFLWRRPGMGGSKEADPSMLIYQAIREILSPRPSPSMAIPPPLEVYPRPLLSTHRDRQPCPITSGPTIAFSELKRMAGFAEGRGVGKAGRREGGRGGTGGRKEEEGTA
ncbi:hypothetical protein NGA_0198800 [Nannochloropsis gaditana CCMP526]|uniref:uncharacterized protein n=1 Tax=Nannochloropsis gaditana (strain CCMP526) TaxID=1093141 RepID=UPI00029F7C4A|nr:hypothetical protein NGA_0198800 [Nannochloropsis gaditana CCMP526]EKU21968.1 hypothetical protein NGA_0198800 [Nannochloropsis gaditana CCMP526]|eukprot:XP_005854390.1 hypothetical protein NGA_0198800 [Nannochloropsis gaditana CCMP526]